MKIKKIIDFIKKSNKMYIFEGEDCQWLSDGFSIYPLFEMPAVDSVSLCTMYDITRKQAAKLLITESLLPTAYDFSDSVENEQLVIESPIELVSGDKTLIPYATSQGIAFADKRYFAPFTDMDEKMLYVYERYTADGELYFAVKNGLILVGIILPVNVINRDFVETINAMSKACTLAFQNLKEGEESYV